MTDQEKQEYLDKLKSKVYNALADISYEVFNTGDTTISPKDQQTLMNLAYEWFDVHFYDENN